MARWADLPTTVEYLATSERHLRRLVHERKIPFHKLGGLLRFDLDEIDRTLKSTSDQLEQRRRARVAG